MDAAHQPPMDEEITPITGRAKKPHRDEADKPSQENELYREEMIMMIRNDVLKENQNNPTCKFFGFRDEST